MVLIYHKIKKSKLNSFKKISQILKDKQVKILMKIRLKLPLKLMNLKDYQKTS